MGVSVPGKPPRHLYRPTAAGLAVLATIPSVDPAPSAARQQRRLREA